MCVGGGGGGGGCLHFPIDENLHVHNYFKLFYKYNITYE